jgi:hypothetical protein
LVLTEFVDIWDWLQFSLNLVFMAGAWVVCAQSFDRGRREGAYKGFKEGFRAAKAINKPKIRTKKVSMKNTSKKKATKKKATKKKSPKED